MTELIEGADEHPIPTTQELNDRLSQSVGEILLARAGLYGLPVPHKEQPFRDVIIRKIAIAQYTLTQAKDLGVELDPEVLGEVASVRAHYPAIFNSFKGGWSQ